MTRDNPSIAIVAPRNMRFSPHRATSIDLHIHETALRSRYRETSTVFAEEVENPFGGVATRFWPKGARTKVIAGMIRGHTPDLIVAHQHLPTAHALARACPEVPVILLRHNFQKPPRNALSRVLKRRQMERLAAIGFVSECCRADFARVWPGVRAPVELLLNGVDTALWRPAETKDHTILFVGRLAPEKGALEAAEAMAETLRAREGWRGLMIVSDAPEHPDYAARVGEVVAGSAGRIDMLKDIAHDAVRERMGRGAISLAPTQNREPFGRVAVEALASGTALIATAKGGFVEIVGEAGVLLDEPNGPSLTAALGRLMDDGAERARLGAAGRERVVPRYDLSRTVAGFDALAARMLAGVPS